MNNQSTNQGGHRTNLTDADRKKGGTNSHHGLGSGKGTKGTHLTGTGHKKDDHHMQGSRNK